MRVGIVGLGMVGKETLLNLYYFSSVREILIYDLNKDRVSAEIDDFEDARPLLKNFSDKKLTMVADCSGLTDCHIVIVNVSTKASGKVADRIAALADNEALMVQIAPEIAKYSPNAYVIITSNPVDPMSYFFLKYSGMDSAHVIGTGTILDSARLTLFLAKHYNIAESSINAWVLGEHGKTSFIPWSLVQIAGMPLSVFEKISGVSPIDRDAVLKKVIDRGLVIFNARGYTDHAIGASVFSVFTAIAQDEKKILPVTCPLAGQYGIKDTHIGALAILGSNGIEKILEVPLLEDEMADYYRSAKFLQTVIQDLKNRR